ncbi:MAG: type II secretion system F family protein [Planctomycetaceae bacterium]
MLRPFWILLTFRTRGARQAMLLSTIAAALEKNIPLAPLLEAFGDDIGGRSRYRLRSLADLLHAGVSIPDALEATPGVVSPDVVMLVRVGASSGRLIEALRAAAARISRRAESTIWPAGRSLLYLVSLGLILAAVWSFILYWIVPKFKAIFDGFDMDLPELTVTVINASDVVVTHYYVVFPLVIVGIGAAMSLILMFEGLSPIGLNTAGWFVKFVPRIKAPLILRGLSLAVEAQRPAQLALAEMASRHPDLACRRLLAGICEEVDGGTDTWQALGRAGLLRRGEVGVLNAAQRAGNLAWVLQAVAESADRRFEYRLRIVAEFLRPVGLLLAGGVVAFFVVGLFLPLVKILQEFPIE